MAGDRRKLRIFLSSPGDVAQERERAAAVVRALDAEIAAGEVSLEALRWEEDWFSAVDHFQAQIVKPSDCELVVCIFGERLGSELPQDYARPDGSRRTGTEWEFEVAMERARASAEKRPDILVYRRRRPLQAEPPGDLERAQRQALDGFWKRWFLSEDGQYLAAFKRFDTPDHFARLFAADLRRWLDERERQAAWPVATKGSPYRGLAAFDESHASVFFGRRRATEQARARLVALAQDHLPFLLILGMSGAGKSSLLRAGLVPRLMQPGATPGIEAWRRLVLRPAELSPDPVAGLAQRLLAPDVLPELAASGDAAAVARRWRDDPVTAGEDLRAALDRVGDLLARTGGHSQRPTCGLLLGLDQLEEILAWTASERALFLRLLRALLETRELWLVATLRSDLYHLVQAEPDLARLKEAGRGFDLPPPADEERREIVEGPARAAGLRFERDAANGEDLADRLIADAEGANSLPLLQFALAELFDRRDRAQGLLRLESYRAMGGLPGAMERHAEAALAAQPQAEQDALPAVLFALSAAKEDAAPGELAITAATVPASLFSERSPQRRLLDALVEARLVSSAGDAEAAADGGVSYRVAHEALFTHWQRARAILGANRVDLGLRSGLQRQAQAWEAGGGQADDLLRGARLSQARDLINRRGGDMDFEPALRRYVDASATAAERAGRRRRRALVGVIATLSLLLLAAVVMGLVALQQREAAEAQRAEAQRSSDVAVDAVQTLVTTTAGDLKRIAGVPSSRIIELLRKAESGLAVLAEAPERQSPAMMKTRITLLLAFSDAYRDVGDLGEAFERVESAAGIARQLVAATGEAPDALYLLSNSLTRLGDLAIRIGQNDAALAAYSAGLEISRRLHATAPDNLAWQRDLAVNLAKLGDVLRRQGDLAGALSAYEESLDLRRGLAAAEPNSVRYQNDIAWALDRLGDLKLERGFASDALGDFVQALAIRRALLLLDTANSDLQRDLASSLARTGDALRRLNNAPAAEAAYVESLAIRRALSATDPANLLWQQELAHSLQRVGDSRQQAGDGPRAAEYYGASVEIRRRLVEHDASNLLWQLELLAGLYRLASVAADPLLPLLEAWLLVDRLLRDGRLPVDAQVWVARIAERLVSLPLP